MIATPLGLRSSAAALRRSTTRYLSVCSLAALLGACLFFAVAALPTQAQSPGEVLDVKKITDLNGIFDEGDKFGAGAAGIGDVDGDGVPDVIVGAYSDDDAGTAAGAAYVLLLDATGAVKEGGVQKITNGSGGLPDGTLDSSSFFGWSAAGIGDVDGDGVPDVVVSTLGRETVYVLFLDTTGRVKPGGVQKIANGSGGLDSDALPSGDFGYSVAGIGDLDGDGVPDILVGDPQENGGDGAVYILLLDATGAVKSGGLQKITDGTNGLPSGTIDSFSEFGSGAAGLGDVDGDGIPDVLVGAKFDDTGARNAGAAYVLLLDATGVVKTNGTRKISDGAELPSGTLGESYHFGESATGIGDVDGDGVPDVLVGADGDGGSNGDNSGAVYVLFLNGPRSSASDPAPGTVKAGGVQKISDGTGGLPSGTLDGFVDLDNRGDSFGFGAAGIGDVNGDGVPDVLVGAPGDDDGRESAGAAYVLLLDATGSVQSGGTRKISDLNLPPPTGVVPLASSDFFGGSATGIGDVNGDGVPDVLVGAEGDDTGASEAGAVYVLFLDATGTAGPFETQKIGNGTGGLPAGTLDADDRFGSGAAGIGDVDGDGVPDVLVGATGDDDGASRAGAAYVLFLNGDGTVKGQRKISNGTGGLAAGTLEFGDQFGAGAAGLGDVDGDGVPDVLVGADGDDTGERGAGAAYVLLLNDDGTVKGQQKISNGTGGLAAGTLAGDDLFGRSAAGIGDVNGDGVPDVIVGATGDDTGVSSGGAAYVLLLDATGAVISGGTRKIAEGTGGLPTGTLGSGDGFGAGVAGIGDLDRDGVADVLVGATGDDDGASAAGAAYALLLDATGAVKAGGVQKISNGTGGLPAGTLDRSDFFGSGAAGLGDLNGDGVPDVLVGANGDDTGGSSTGAAYVLLLDGSPSSTATVTLSISVPGLFTFGASGVRIDFAAGTVGPGAVTVARFDDAPSNTDGLPAGSTVSTYRIVITAGTGLTVGSGTEVRFDVSRFQGTIAPADITVYSRPDVGSGTFTEVPTTYNATVGELVATVDGFSEFVFTSDNSDNTLPVELTGFTATADAEDVLLRWRTLAETGNAGFAVEHRVAAPAGSDRWRELGFVEGAGTTTDAQSYTFRAEQVGFGRHAFRLRQTDLDGTTALSRVVELEVKSGRPYLLRSYPSPVPAGGAARIDLTVQEAQAVVVEVYDVLGRRVTVLFDGELTAGRTRTMRLSGTRLSSGLYFVRATGPAFTVVSRVLFVE